jgi:FtsH-binding integral membrane protein
MVNSSLYNKLYKGGSLNKTNNINKNLSNSGLMTLLNEKKGFLLQVFSNLIFQLLVTFIVAFNIKSDMLDKNMYFWLIILFQFLIIAVLAFIPMHPFIKFLLMTIFSACWGLILGKMKEQVSPEIIKTAILGVLGIFVSMFLISLLMLTMGIKLGFGFGLFLFYALLLLIVLNIVLFVMNKQDTYHKIIAIVSIILFSFYIIYDTQNILQRDYYGDFITASMDYYLDVINIFISLVDLQN